MPYDWKIELSGVDITDKVSRFQVDADLLQYCRELTVEIADPAFYAGLDFSTIPEAPALEVFTMTGSTWVSQGEYFMERPVLSSDINQDVINSLWGRSTTARLGAPFAPRVSKMWGQDTSFFSICAEMCALCGLTWDDGQAAIEDFYIFAFTYQVENAYPVDVLAELAELAGALLTTDRLGRVLIRARDYAPATSAATIEDADWQAISENPGWPDFGNRVRIIPNESLAGYSLSLTVPDACLPPDGASRARLYARVTGTDGQPLEGETVNWTTDAGSATLAAATSTTREALMPEEELRAASRYEINLAHPPAAVLGVWAYGDFTRTTDLAAGGYSIEDQRLVLVDPLAFCDQLVRVRYTVAGMAENYLVAGSEAEDVTVTAETAGVTAEAELFVGNDCRCPASLTLTAEPTSVDIPEVSQLLVCAEEGGAPVLDRIVSLYETGAQHKGTLTWRQARLQEAVVWHEATAADNPAVGVTQCDVRHPIKDSATVRVYRVDENGQATGGDLYNSHTGKTITLGTLLVTGTKLVASYTALGCAVNHFRGEIAGTAYFKARIQSNREEGLEADATVRVNDPTDPLDIGNGIDDAGGGGYGGQGGDDGLELDPGNCMLNDGTMVVCSGEGDNWNSAEVCCEKAGVYGCYPRTECEDSQNLDQCAPELLAYEPGGEEGTERFASLKDAGCSCEQICQTEFNLLGTTQGYDSGSYRTIEEIVQEDDGLAPVEGGDNTAYWAAVDARRADALADCIADCSLTPLECSPDNAETIAPEASVLLAVVGGRPPFQWSVSGDDFTMSAAETSGWTNTLIAGADACGTADVSVVDGAGQSCQCSIRCTEGQWINLDNPTPCLAYGEPTEGVAMGGYGTLIAGKYKIIEEKYFNFRCSLGGAWFDNCHCGSCNYGGYDEDVCITGHECPPVDPGGGTGAVLTFENKVCCYYVSQEGPTAVTYCRYPRWRGQFEWRC